MAGLWCRTPSSFSITRRPTSSTSTPALAEVGVLDALEGLAIGASTARSASSALPVSLDDPARASRRSPCPRGSGSGCEDGRELGAEALADRLAHGRRARGGLRRAPRSGRARLLPDRLGAGVCTPDGPGRRGCRAGRPDRSPCRARSRCRGSSTFFSAPRRGPLAYRSNDSGGATSSRRCCARSRRRLPDQRQSSCALMTTGASSWAQVWSRSTSLASRSSRVSRVWITSTPMVVPCTISGRPSATRSAPPRSRGSTVVRGCSRACSKAIGLAALGRRAHEALAEGQTNDDHGLAVSSPMVALRVRWRRSVSVR